MKTITLFGDSILFGIIINEKGKYARNANFDLRSFAKDYGFDLLNISRMGRNSREGVDTVLDYLSEHDAPDYAVIEFGGNDADHPWAEIAKDPTIGSPKIPIDEYVENLKKMAEILKSKGVKIAYMNLPPVISKPYFDFVTPTAEAKENVLKFLGRVDVISDVHISYNDAVEKLARDTGERLIDIRSPFFQNGDITPYVCSDGVHPSLLGHDLIKAEFGKYLDSIK